jgi:aminopeptidase N
MFIKWVIFGNNITHFLMQSLKFFFFTFWIGTFICFAQQTDIVDFKLIRAKVKLFSSEKKVSGTAVYSFEVLKDCDSIFLDGINIDLIDTVSNQSISVSSDGKKLWLVTKFKKNQSYEVGISYEAFPKQALYFTGDQIWTQGQGKYTSNWLPSIDDMNDKIEFDLSIYAPKDLQVIANGKLDVVKKSDDKNIWFFDMEEPMSSYLAAFVIGKFNHLKVTSESGITILLYYRLEDTLMAEPTYRYTKQIFDFLEEEIGVPYPWQNYKQVPVRDFLYAGMENTSATFFSEAFVVDSIGFNDRNYVNVNAHELAHHWFGNLITATSGKHHWLQEGFSTYYALLAEKEIFGEDYFYWKLYQSAEQLKMLSDQGKGESLLDPKASSLTFYEKGAWALHILREMIGEASFKEAIINYLNRYSFKNVTTDYFLNEVSKVYEGDLSVYKKNWLEQSSFKAEEAFQYLLKSELMNDFFELSSLRENSIDEKKEVLDRALDRSDDFIGQEVVYQLEGEDISKTIELYKKAFKSKNLYTRQAIALSLSAIPIEIKERYESLLNDDSYITIESALGNLWANFPEKRSDYLNATKDIIGFQDRNVKQLWLVLSIITEGYYPEKQLGHLNELKSYTSSDYSFEIRERALGYVNYFNWWDETTLINLVDACMHHNWRFRKTARTYLRDMIEMGTYLDQLLKIQEELDGEKADFLRNSIDELGK